MLCSVSHSRDGPVFYIAIISISLVFKVESALETSPQPIVAAAGDDVILPCQLVPPVDARSLNITWTKPGLDFKYIYVFKDGRQVWLNPNPDYTHHAAMFMDQLEYGNVSLKLLRVKLLHAGRYACISSSWPTEVSVQLVVGAVSTPTVEVSSINNQQVVLQCRSQGWYPEPLLSWLDGEGNLIPAHHEATVKTADGLYEIVSTVVVKQHDNYTCRVQNPLNQTRHRLIRVPADFFRESCRPLIWITLASWMVTVLVLCYIGWDMKRNQRMRPSSDLHEVQVFDSDMKLLPNDLSRDSMSEPNSADGSQTGNPPTSENHLEDHSTEQPGQSSSGSECSSLNGGSDAFETNDHQQQVLFQPNGNVIYKRCQNGQENCDN